MAIECYIGINYMGWYGRIVREEKEDIYWGPYTKRFKEQITNNIGRVKIEQIYLDPEQQENLILEGKTCKKNPVVFVIEDYSRIKDYSCFKQFHKKISKHLASNKKSFSLSRQHLYNVAKISVPLFLLCSNSADSEIQKGSINMEAYLEWINQHAIVEDMSVCSESVITTSPNFSIPTIGSSSNKEELLTIGSSNEDRPHEFIDDDIIVFEEAEPDKVWQDENLQITIGSSREILNEIMDVRDIKLPYNINDIIIEQYETNHMIDPAIIKFMLAKRANECGVLDRVTIGVICAIFDLETEYGTSPLCTDKFNFGGETQSVEKMPNGELVRTYYDRCITDNNGNIDVIASLEYGVNSKIKNVLKLIEESKTTVYYIEPTSVSDVMNNIGRVYAYENSKFEKSTIQLRPDDIRDYDGSYWTLSTEPNRDSNGIICDYYEDYVAGMVPDSIQKLDQFIEYLGKNSEKTGNQKVLKK